MRIGSTSWIEPGTYYHNARLLAELVDFVELLVYTWNKETEILLKKEIPLLKSLNLMYTVHLPTDNLVCCERAYSFFTASGLKSLNFTLHPLSGWEGFIAGRQDISLENLEVNQPPLYRRMTLDIGHSLLTGLRPDYFAGVEVSEVHLSGVSNGEAHREITEKELLFLKSLKRDDLLVNVEVFEKKTLVNSLRRLKEWRD